jgi:hypothetical protein
MEYVGGILTGRTTLTWDFNLSPHGYENILTGMDYNPQSSWRTESNILFSTVWNPNTGDFTVTTMDEWMDEPETFHGMFVHNPDGSFAISIEVIEERWDERIFFEISGQPGVPVPSVDFINLSDWDSEILALLEMVL